MINAIVYFISLVALLLMEETSLHNTYGEHIHQSQKCKIVENNIDLKVSCMSSLNIDTQVDELVKEYVLFDVPVSVVVNSNFPSGIIGPNWYNGELGLHCLSIFSYNLKAIAANAFDSKAFRHLRILNINFHSPIEYNCGMLNALHSLEVFSSSELEHPAKICSNLFEPVRKTIKRFYNVLFDAKLGVHSLNYLFGGTKLSRMDFIYIKNLDRSQQQNRILAPTNFTALLIIQELLLPNCGIGAILEKTFDFIGVTLKRLDLSGNGLKTFDINLFRVFLDAKLRTGTINVGKCLLLNGNPMKSSCELYNLRNITMISFGYYEYQREAIKCFVTEHVPNIIPIDSDRCDGFQIIHPGRLHLNHSKVDVYAYPKFQLDFDIKEATLSITQRKRGRFRLFIQIQKKRAVMKHKKCPCRLWLTESVQCVRLENASLKIDVRKYLLESELTTFCVIYVTSIKRIWPLHCVTIRSSIANQEVPPEVWTQFPIQNIIFFLTSISGILLGTLIVPLKYLRYKQISEEMLSYDSISIIPANPEICSENARRVSYIEFDDYEYVEHRLRIHPMNRHDLCDL